MNSPLLSGPGRWRRRQVLRWWTTLHWGTDDERERLVASLSADDLDEVAALLDMDEEQVLEGLRAAVFECVEELQRTPFYAPV